MAQEMTNAFRALMAPTGELRAAINYGNPVLAQRDAADEPTGVSADLARELARRLGVPVRFTGYETAGDVVKALEGAAPWDVAFLAIDPLRAETIAFSPPYVIIEGAYMVRQASPLSRNEEVDTSGVQVVVGRNTAYDLYLSRNLKAAGRVFAPTSAAALADFVGGAGDVLASVRQPLAVYAKDHPDVRLLPGHFMVIEQAVAIPAGAAGAGPDIRAFIEEMKASGFVARALAASGQHDAQVAPAA